jgi:hypothetical protein
MADIADLERRVIALEEAQGENTKTLNWVVGTLGRLAADVSVVKEDVRGVQSDVAALRREFHEFQRTFPTTVAEVMREVLKDRD